MQRSHFLETNNITYAFDSTIRKYLLKKEIVILHNLLLKYSICFLYNYLPSLIFLRYSATASEEPDNEDI